jgi:hypothetical protein
MAGGTMLGGEHCDDMAYARLVNSVADINDLPAELSNEPDLLRMIARGLGIDEVPPRDINSSKLWLQRM